MRLPRSWGPFVIVAALAVQQGTQVSLVPPFLHQLGYPPAVIGGQVTAMMVASLLSRLPAGLLYRPGRVRGVQAVALLAMAILLALHAFVFDPLGFLLVRLLSGFAFGLVSTVNLARFVDEQPPGPGRSRAMGYYVAGIPVGYSISSVLVGYVVEAWGYTAAFGVGAALSLVGLLGALDRTPVAAAAVPVAARPDPSPQQRGGVILAALTGGVPLRRLLGAPAMLVLVLESFLLNAHWAFWNAWLPLYALAVGITLAEVGMLRGAFGATNTVSRVVGGHIVDRVGAQRLATLSLVVQCLLLMGLPAFPVLSALFPIFVLVGWLRAMGIVANTVAMVERSDAQGLGRGPMAGLLSTVTDLGLLAGPALGGLIVEVAGPIQVFLVWPLLALLLYLTALGARGLARGESR
jgi:MFS family permease